MPVTALSRSKGALPARRETLNDPVAGYLDRNAEDTPLVRKKAATPVKRRRPMPGSLGA
jgi:hypothetical protein